MERLYRTDYEGEFVVHLTNKWKGHVEQVREWIPNTVVHSHTGHALVLGNGLSRAQFPAGNDVLLNHKGGLNASKKLTIYGCNALHRDIAPHVLVVTHPIIANEVSVAGHAKNSIVMTNHKNILAHPGEFHLIPFNPSFDAGSTALYLAAFDKHNHVYFMGFDGHDSTEFNNNVYAGTSGYAARTAHVSSEQWVLNSKTVFDTYHNTEFIRVVPYGGETMPEPWKYCNNVRQISFRQFISECDIGVT